jgi:muconolactone D-isomerase
MEFLVRIELVAPPGIDAEELANLRTREAQRARELAAEGNIVRLWRSESTWGNWGLWSCESQETLLRLLESLPLRPFMTIDIHDLGQHPSDPQLHIDQQEDQLHG